MLESYNWEKAPTRTQPAHRRRNRRTYNYIYYTVAGFTEHDTFRSNQIREGCISRKEASNLVLDETGLRYSQTFGGT